MINYTIHIVAKIYVWFILWKKKQQITEKSCIYELRQCWVDNKELRDIIEETNPELSFNEPEKEVRLKRYPVLYRDYNRINKAENSQYTYEEGTIDSLAGKPSIT